MKLFKKIAVAGIGLAMAMGGLCLAGAETKSASAAVNATPVYQSGTPDWGNTTYGCGNKILNNVTWYITNYGGFTNGIGWNTAKQKQTSAVFGPLGSISETSKIGLYQVGSDFANAAKISVSISNYDLVTGNYYIYTSVDAGVTWTQQVKEVLESSTSLIEFNNGSKIGDNVRFAFGFGTSKTTKTRIKIDNIAVFEEVEAKEIESIVISDLSVYVGESKTLSLLADPAGSELPDDLVYEIEDEEVASVDTNGTVTGLKSGSTTVTVSSASKTLSATATITVNAYPFSGVEVGKSYALITKTVSNSIEFTGISSTSTPYGTCAAFTTTPSFTKPLTVVDGLRPGTVAFEFDGKYLSWTTGNSLTSSASVDINSSWVVTLTSGVYKVVNLSTYSLASDNQRVLCGNVNADPQRFATYAYSAKQSDVQFIEAPSAEDEAAALTFAQDFKAALATICADEEANNSTALSAVWADWKADFEALSAGAKECFNTSDDATIAGARSLYAHVVGRYSLATWEGATPVASAAPFGAIMNNNANIMLIAVIALVSIAGVALILKKKASAK